MRVGKEPRRFSTKVTTSAVTAGQTLATIPYTDSNADRTALIVVTVRGWRAGVGWSTRLINAITSTQFIGTTSVTFSLGTSLGTLSLDDNGAAGPFTLKVTPGSATSTKWWIDVEIGE